MATDLIRYDLLVQDAMRGVVRRVLSDVSANGGLPGDHHFTISFRTDAPGVKMSRRLAEQWPQELTIILQHQYSNLSVEDEGFGVTLSFRSVPEHIYIPYDAITGFYDPSVEFGLRFEIADEEEEEEESAPPRPSLVSTRAVDDDEDAKPAPARAERAEKPKKAEAPAPAVEGAGAEGDAKVVSIDAFRKKT